MVATVKTHMSHGDWAAQLKKQQGAYLKDLRNASGLTQAEVAKALDCQWPSMVGGFEGGRFNLPPEKYLTFAQTVGVDPQEFVKNMLRWHNPWAYSILFPGEAVSPKGLLTASRSGPVTERAGPKKPTQGKITDELPHTKEPRPRQPVGGTYDHTKRGKGHNGKTK